jgi:hypothetical protein
MGFNPSSAVGVIADAGISYNEGADAVNEAAILAGLRYTFRRSRLSPYVEALGGGARRSVTAGGMTLAAWDSTAQVGTGVLVSVRPGSYLRASVDFRSVFGGGGSAQRFRLLLGGTLGLGHSGRRASKADAPAREVPPAPIAAPAQAQPTASAPLATAPGQSPTSEPPPSSNIVQFPTQQPAMPTPAPAALPPAAPTAPSGRSLPEGFAQGAQLLRSGRYADASAAFQGSLRAHAASAFTVAVGLFCDENNVTQLMAAARDSGPLFVVGSLRGGRTCYAVYWGVFASQGEAQRAIGSVPDALRSRGQAPVAVSRLLR